MNLSILLSGSAIPPPFRLGGRGCQDPCSEISLFKDGVGLGQIGTVQQRGAGDVRDGAGGMEG